MQKDSCGLGMSSSLCGQPSLLQGLRGGTAVVSDAAWNVILS